MSAQQYFGWSPFPHAPDCKRGGDVELDYKVAEQPALDKTTVKVRGVCRTCRVALLLTADVPDSAPGYGHTFEITDTATAGYGSPPVRMAGLIAWPGERFLPGWAPASTNPVGTYLLTRTPVCPRDKADVVGAVYARRTQRGAIRYGGVVGYDPAEVTGPDHFKTAAAAAKWVAGQLAEQEEVPGR